jgi:hypothetical protein
MPNLNPRSWFFIFSPLITAVLIGIVGQPALQAAPATCLPHQRIEPIVDTLAYLTTRIDSKTTPKDKNALENGIKLVRRMHAGGFIWLGTSFADQAENQLSNPALVSEETKGRPIIKQFVTFAKQNCVGRVYQHAVLGRSKAYSDEPSVIAETNPVKRKAILTALRIKEFSKFGQYLGERVSATGMTGVLLDTEGYAYNWFFSPECETSVYIRQDGTSGNACADKYQSDVTMANLPEIDADTTHDYIEMGEIFVKEFHKAAPGAEILIDNQVYNIDEDFKPNQYDRCLIKTSNKPEIGAIPNYLYPVSCELGTRAHENTHYFDLLYGMAVKMHEDNLGYLPKKRTNLKLIMRNYGVTEALSYRPANLGSSIFANWRFARGLNLGPIYDTTGRQILEPFCGKKGSSSVVNEYCPSSKDYVGYGRAWQAVQKTVSEFSDTWNDWKTYGDVSFMFEPYNHVANGNGAGFKPAINCVGIPKFGCPKLTGLYGVASNPVFVRSAMVDWSALLNFFRLWDVKTQNPTDVSSPSVVLFYDDQNVFYTPMPGHTCLMPDGSSVTPEPDMPCFGVLMRGIFDRRAAGDK